MLGVSVNLAPPLWKTVWKSLKKSENRTNIWSSYQTTGCLSKGNEISM